MKKKSKKTLSKIIIIAIAIVIVGVASLLYLNNVFTNSTTRYSSFYEEPQNSLDGIYLGSSAAYCFFMPTKAYEKEGMCIYNMGTTVQPSCIWKNIIADALETQTNLDVVIIELRNTVKLNNDEMTRYIRLITDGMHNGKNRIDAINTAVDYYMDDCNQNKLSYYLPGLRVIHLGSYGIKKDDWLLKGEPKSPYKGYTRFGWANVKKLPQPKEYGDTAAIPETTETYMRELLDYCSTIEPKVIFVSAPFNPTSKSIIKQCRMNTICNMCEEAGFTVLNFNREPLRSQLNMDWSKDYRDRGHANAYGAARYSEFLAKWLKSNIKELSDDHRGEKGYEDWDTQADNLNMSIKKKLPDWE